MKTSSFLLGVVTGAAVAATSVLFTTTKSGHDVRLSIKNQAAVTKNQLNDVKLHAIHVKNSMLTLSNEVKNNMPVIINDLKTTIDSFQKEIEPNLSNLQKDIIEMNHTIGEIEKNLDNLNKKKIKTTTK